MKSRRDANVLGELCGFIEGKNKNNHFRCRQQIVDVHRTKTGKEK